MKPAELTPTAQKIDKLIKRIEDGDIKIPAFQRGFVWKQNQVIELLESVINDYPIGSVLLWKSSEKIKSTRNLAGYLIPSRDDTYPVNYVLDGQQRLASLFGVFSQIVEQEPDSNNYNPNLNIFEIYYDFENERFLTLDEIKISENCIHLRQLINVIQLISALNNLNPKFHIEAQELASKFLNYELPVVTIENRNRNDVGIIFERINNTGTRLSTLDLMTAWTWTDDFHLLEESNIFMDELDEKGFGDIKPVTLLQIISGIIQNSTQTENILNLTGDNVRANWSKTLEAVRKAIDFLSTDLNCLHSDFLPFHQQLIGLSKFFFEIDRPTQTQSQQIKQWFWKTSFSKRYSSGQTSVKMDNDIENILSLKKGNNDIFNSYNHDITPQILKNTQFSKSNPITRSLLLLMAQFHPIDLIKDKIIDIGQALSSYNRKEYHHIFPEAFLKKQNVNTNKIYCVVNFCFLSSDSNKQISKKSPSEYFTHLIPKTNFDAILESNIIPVSKNIYLNDDYDTFLEKRSSLIIEKIDRLCNSNS